MKIFNEKFKTRVVHYSKVYYKVEYASYRLIPDWQTLYFWYERSFIDDTECWSIKLMSLEEAEQLAESLKSIEDVETWYKPHEKRRAFFYEKKENFFNHKD